MRKFLLIGLICSSLFNCSDKNKIPAGILPRQKMQEVVWDMTRTAEFLNVFVFNKDSSIDKIAESEKWYNKVYQLHKTTKKEFEKKLFLLPGSSRFNEGAIGFVKQENNSAQAA